MLTRKSPFAQGENDRTIMQDGFSAPVESAPRQRFSSACAMVGRRVMDFSDNGDGTLTAVRCVDRQADDLDIQFEAGACPVVAIAPRAFEGEGSLAVRDDEGKLRVRQPAARRGVYERLEVGAPA